MWLGGKTGVDDDLMDDWLMAVVKAGRRGIVGKKLETTLAELADHLSNGNLCVVRRPATATDTNARGPLPSSKLADRLVQELTQSWNRETIVRRHHVTLAEELRAALSPPVEQAPQPPSPETRV
jgi:hypothetical protein